MNDYWLSQRYEDAFFAIHGHQSGEECSASCKVKGEESPAGMLPLGRLRLNYIQNKCSSQAEMP